MYQAEPLNQVCSLWPVVLKDKVLFTILILKVY